MTKEEFIARQNGYYRAADGTIAQQQVAESQQVSQIAAMPMQTMLVKPNSSVNNSLSEVKAVQAILPVNRVPQIATKETGYLGMKIDRTINGSISGDNALKQTQYVEDTSGDFFGLRIINTFPQRKRIAILPAYFETLGVASRIDFGSVSPLVTTNMNGYNQILLGSMPLPGTYDPTSFKNNSEQIISSATFNSGNISVKSDTNYSSPAELWRNGYEDISRVIDDDDESLDPTLPNQMLTYSSETAFSIRNFKAYCKNNIVRLKSFRIYCKDINSKQNMMYIEYLNAFNKQMNRKFDLRALYNKFQQNNDMADGTFAADFKITNDLLWTMIIDGNQTIDFQFYFEIL